MAAIIFRISLLSLHCRDFAKCWSCAALSRVIKIHVPCRKSLINTCGSFETKGTLSCKRIVSCLDTVCFELSIYTWAHLLVMCAILFPFLTDALGLLISPCPSKMIQHMLFFLFSADIRLLLHISQKHYALIVLRTNPFYIIFVLRFVVWNKRADN